VAHSCDEPRRFKDWRLATTPLLDAILSVVIAPACVCCEQILDRPTDGPVCAACWRSILPLTPPLCDRCGDPLRTWRTQDLVASVCARCRRSGSSIDRARAIGEYDGALRAIVHALKYDGRRSLSKRLAALMIERGADLLRDATCVVPVPLHPSRRRQRGFNQAADLARRLSIPTCHALRRVRATATQASLPSSRRHQNMRGAFAATRRARLLDGAVVVLVDDVCTTGATLDACGRVLKAAGAAEVRALTAARVVARPR
jgi:ComF family protein